MPVTITYTDNEAKLLRGIIEHAECNHRSWKWDAVGTAVGRKPKTANDDYVRILNKMKESLGLETGRRASKRKNEDPASSPVVTTRRASKRKRGDAEPSSPSAGPAAPAAPAIVPASGYKRKRKIPAKPTAATRQQVRDESEDFIPPVRPGSHQPIPSPPTPAPKGKGKGKAKGKGKVKA